MPNRILKESICTSETIEALTSNEECFFYRIIVNCDDFGRMDARIPVITAKCYPLKSSAIRRNHVEKMLLNLQKVDLLFLYEGGRYLQITTWEKHQQIRAKRSKFPAPTENDINGNQVISDDCTCRRNPIQSESNPNPIRNPIQAELFDRFWSAYPNKKSKGQAEKVWAKIKVDEQLLATMIAKIEQAKKSANWSKDGGQFIPHPATWLNAKGWEDDYSRQQSSGGTYADILREMGGNKSGFGSDDETIDIVGYGTPENE